MTLIALSDPIAAPLGSQANARTPSVVIEAVLYSVHTRGLSALKEPDTIERLLRCDAGARAEINSRIDRLFAGRKDA